MSSQPSCVNCGLYVMHGDCLCDDCRPRVRDPKARIAELEAENANKTQALLDIYLGHDHSETALRVLMNPLRQRAEQAEVARDNIMQEMWERLEQAQAALAEREAFSHTLKMCLENAHEELDTKNVQLEEARGSLNTALNLLRAYHLINLRSGPCMACDHTISLHNLA